MGINETCSDIFPEDWLDPVLEVEKYGFIKCYDDGVRVIMGGLSRIDGYTVNPGRIETRYPDRGLHYERGYKSAKSLYIPDGIPENAEI